MNKPVFRSLRRAEKRLRAALKTDGEREDDRWLADNRRLLFAALRETGRLLRAVPSPDAPALFAACRACADGGDRANPARLREAIAPLEADILLCEALPALLAGAAAVNAAACFGANDGRFPALVRWILSLGGLDFGALLPAVCPAEALLCEDPAGAYAHSDEATRSVYRKRLARLAKNAGVSQTEAARELLRKSRKGRRHIGFYLAAPPRRAAPFLFLAAEALLPAAAEAVGFLALRRAGFSASAPQAAVAAVLCYLPLFACLRPFTDRLAAALFGPRFLPSMDPEDPAVDFPSALITVSMLLPRAGEAEALYDRLLALYDSGSLPNVRLCALFDYPAAQTPTLPTDTADVAAARRVIDRLNDTCGGGFLMLLRDRVYAETENEYTGFERKRGAIEALVREIRTGDGGFSLRHGDADLRGFRYLLALDADTGLPFEELRRLLAVAAHPMNAAVLENGRVVSGYGCFSPRTETAAASAAKTVFSALMNAGGIGAYRPRVSERNMDLFGTGLFCGKGLIDVEAYAETCADAFPGGRVLSHDILEGEALKTAFVGNCVLTESFPASPAAYYRRQERWIRGDVQNLRFLLPSPQGERERFRARPLTAVRLLDNARRALTPVNAALCLLPGALFPAARPLFWVGLAAAVAPGLFAACSLLLREGLPSFFRLSHLRILPAGLRTLLRAALSAAFLPQEAAVSGAAILRALYRSLVSRKRTLEWTPAAESERAGGMRLYTVYLPALFALTLSPGPLPAKLLAAAVLAAIPFAASNGIRRAPRRQAAPEGAAYETLREYAAATWRYFGTFAGEEDRFLPPDNVQFTPVRRVAHRTSPTNIGLYLLSALAAADLSLISASELLHRLSAALETVRALPVYRGLLYNWYDTRTLRPLSPRFVSSVDCGNFLVCLSVLRQGLREYAALEPGFLPLIEELGELIGQADLAFLYDPVRRLFTVGFDADRQAFSAARYDTYMSEARMTSYFAVAHRLIPPSHWARLDRRLIRGGLRAAVLSYSGTAFEYWFPTLFLPVPENSLSEAGLRACFAAQRRRRGRPKALPFGVSESGCYAFDEALNYRYRAHGLTSLALRRDPHDEAVFAPYATFLFLPFYPRESMKNLARFAACGAYGEFGFYEALDATARAGREDYMAVRSVMAHHAGMSLVAAANALTGARFVKRFLADRALLAAERLLEERFPVEAPVLHVVRSRRKPADRRRARRDPPAAAPRVGVFSDGEATLLCDLSGRNRMLFAGHTLLGFSPRSAGAFTAVRIDGALAPQLGAAPCALKETCCERESAVGGCGVRAAAALLKNAPAFALPVRVKNRADAEKQVAVYWYFEPKLLPKTEPDPHPAFSDLGLRAGFHAGLQALIFTRAGRDSPALVAALHSRETLFFCCDREEILGTDPARRFPFQNREPAFDCCTEMRAPAAAVKASFALAPGESRETVLLLIPGATKEEALTRLAALRRTGLPDIRCAVPESLAAAGPAYRAAEALLAETEFGAFLPAAAGRRAENRAPAEALWERGVSGDLPLLCADADALPPRETERLIRTHARLLACGIPHDLILLTRRPADYENAALSRLTETIRRCGGRGSGDGGCCRALNANECSPRFLSALSAAASAVLPEADDAPPVLPPPAPFAPLVGAPLFEGENGFVPGGYFIREKQGFRPWCHTLANPSFGTLLSARSLGYTWAMNARQNKLTRWNNDVCSDLDGERLELACGGAVWDCAAGAAVYFYGERAVYGSVCGGVSVRITVQIDRRAMKKRLRVEYAAPRGARPVFTYRLSLLADEDARRRAFLHINCEPSLAVFFNPSNTDYPGFGAVYASVPAEAVAEGQTLSLTVRTEESTGGFDLFLIFSAKERGLAALRALPFSGPAQKNAVFETGDRRLDLFASALLVHQASVTRVLARTGFYQCSGAYGFRDQLQDTANLCAIFPAAARLQLLRCAAAQFPEGDVLHWFHAVPASAPHKKGVRTRCSDDLLWLPWAAARYLRITGDAAVFDLTIPFLEGALLGETERERYGAYHSGKKAATLYGHCLRAIRRVAGDTGEHGLPRIRGGDWNDAMGNVGPAGRGESVWLAMFLRLACRDFSAVCEARGDRAAARELKSTAEEMEAAVLRHAWNGSVFLRAFFDDGAPLGGGEGPCAADLLTQAFAELSETGTPAQRARALKTAYEKLFDRASGTVALFAPPFTEADRRAGYVNDYPAGVRENGGQYTHAAVWFAEALFHAGMPTEAGEILGAILPCKAEPAAARRYLNEPYALSGDVRRGGRWHGVGGWSLYTGAAGVLAALLKERFGFTAVD